MPRYPFQDKQCFHELHDELWASYVAPPPSGHDFAIPEFEWQRGDLSDSVGILINIRRLTVRSQFCFVKTFTGGQDATIYCLTWFCNKKSRTVHIALSVLSPLYCVHNYSVARCVEQEKHLHLDSFYEMCFLAIGKQSGQLLLRLEDLGMAKLLWTNFVVEVLPVCAFYSWGAAGGGGELLVGFCGCSSLCLVNLLWEWLIHEMFVAACFYCVASHRNKINRLSGWGFCTIALSDYAAFFAMTFTTFTSHLTHSFCATRQGVGSPLSTTSIATYKNRPWILEAEPPAQILVISAPQLPRFWCIWCGLVA